MTQQVSTSTPATSPRLSSGIHIRRRGSGYLIVCVSVQHLLAAMILGRRKGSGPHSGASPTICRSPGSPRASTQIQPCNDSAFGYIRTCNYISTSHFFTALNLPCTGNQNNTQRPTETPACRKAVQRSVYQYRTSAASPRPSHHPLLRQYGQQGPECLECPTGLLTSFSGLPS